MNFYFYTNKNLVFDYLSRNIIAPNSIVRDVKEYRTISTRADNYLFITHKKLDYVSRAKGIAEPDNVCPVAFKLSEVEQYDCDAILVEEIENKYILSIDNLQNYDVKRHVGAFVIGEIPFSRVEKIYFDTQENLEAFSRPSPDYWYPVSKFDILPGDFSESLDLNISEEEITHINITTEDILAGIRAREKDRAALLNFVNSTMTWQYGKYVFSIDHNLQVLLGLDDSEISQVLPHFCEMRDTSKSLKEPMCLCNEYKAIEKTFNQMIYDCIYHRFSSVIFNTEKNQEEILKIVECIKDDAINMCKNDSDGRVMATCFNLIIDIILDTSELTPEEIMSKIPEPIDVLRALFLVVKNPNRFDLFQNSLNSYHIDQITRRRASMLWGALNGLYGMPGEEHNKDNEALWRFVEAKVLSDDNSYKPTFSVKKEPFGIVDGTILGLNLTEDRILSSDEVRDFVMSVPSEQLKADFYRTLMDMAIIDCGSKKKAENKGYCVKTASIDFTIMEGSELTKAHIEKLNQLLKDSKNLKPNREKLYEDYILDNKRFEIAFSNNRSFWKQWYMKTKKGLTNS